jgi:hypothetical protein
MKEASAFPPKKLHCLNVAKFASIAIIIVEESGKSGSYVA